MQKIIFPGNDTSSSFVISPLLTSLDFGILNLGALRVRTHLTVNERQMNGK